MRFRKYLFTILALLALLWIIAGLSSVSTANEKQLQAQSVPASGAAKLGDAAVTGIATSIVLCSGVPLFFLFALLAWRNAAGIANKKRHEETIAVLKQNQKE